MKDERSHFLHELPTNTEVITHAPDHFHEPSTGDRFAVLTKFQGMQQNVEHFASAYRQYCWTVESLDDLKLAPFHLLATEGNLHINQNHAWHMETSP